MSGIIKESERVWVWKKAKWEKFTNHLEQAKFDRPLIMTTQKIEKQLDKIYHVINKAKELSIPSFIPSGTSNSQLVHGKM